MNHEEAKKIGATHHWTNEFGTAYYCYCEQIKRWLHYDKHHDHWTCQKKDSFVANLKPL